MCKARFVSQCFVFKSPAYKRECSVIARVRERKKERERERWRKKERVREKERRANQNDGSSTLINFSSTNLMRILFFSFSTKKNFF